MNYSKVSDWAVRYALLPRLTRLFNHSAARWRLILLLAVVMASPTKVWCDTMTFSAGPADSFSGVGHVNLFSSALDGTVLAGQTLSLNLVLSNDVLARIFVSDPTAFSMLLVLDTQAGSFPGFATSTTGYLLDQFGNPLSDPLTVGPSESCCPGSTAIVALFPPDSPFSGMAVGEISGIHFDVTLPNSGFTVTDAFLGFVSQSQYDGVQFGTLQELPEPSALGLTLIGALAIGLASILRRAHFLL